MTSRLRRLVMVVSLLLFVFVTERPAIVAPAPPLPNPILYLIGTETFTSGGKTFTRFKYDVFNKDAYPADFFAAAPQLPPCGNTTNASRTWVDFFDQNGRRLQGFCALSKPADLSKIWFALEEDKVPRVGFTSNSWIDRPTPSTNRTWPTRQISLEQKHLPPASHRV